MVSILGKLGGRKFIVAVFAAIAVGLHSWLGISEEVVYTIGGIAASYILGQGVADGLSGGRTSSTAPVIEEK